MKKLYRVKCTTYMYVLADTGLRACVIAGRQSLDDCAPTKFLDHEVKSIDDIEVNWHHAIPFADSEADHPDEKTCAQIVRESIDG